MWRRVGVGDSLSYLCLNVGSEMIVYQLQLQTDIKDVKINNNLSTIPLYSSTVATSNKGTAGTAFKH